MQFLNKVRVEKTAIPNYYNTAITNYGTACSLFVDCSKNVLL